MISVLSYVSRNYPPRKRLFVSSFFFGGGGALFGIPIYFEALCLCRQPVCCPLEWSYRFCVHDTSITTNWALRSNPNCYAIKEQISKNETVIPSSTEERWAPGMDHTHHHSLPQSSPHCHAWAADSTNTLCSHVIQVKFICCYMDTLYLDIIQVDLYNTNTTSSWCHTGRLHQLLTTQTQLNLDVRQVDSIYCWQHIFNFTLMSYR